MLPNGNYTVKLYFAELYQTAANMRKFNVSINGVSKLTNYDIWADAGGTYKGVEKVFTGIPVTEGQLNIAFTSVTNYACVNAIVVQSE